MYVAVLSEQKVTWKKITQEIEKCGFIVVGHTLEIIDDPPSNIYMWLMFGYHRLLGINTNLTCQGYVRVGSESPDIARLKVIDSPWWVVIYYHVLLWVTIILRRKDHDTG